MPEYRRVEKGHPYFADGKWQNGTLIIKGKEYRNVSLKYNIETDQLILHTRINSSDFVNIILNKELINSFYLNSQYFINLSKWLPNQEKSGYFELLYNKGFTFMLHYYKKLLLEQDKNTNPVSR